MENSSPDTITPEQARTLPGLFRERVERTPDAAAYRFFDALNGVWSDASWREMGRGVVRWQQALLREKLEFGDRVAIMARNSRLWVMFDQAALSLGLVVVPVFSDDRADNVRYILEHSDSKLLVIGGAPQWERLQGKLENLRTLKRVVTMAEIEDPGDKRVVLLNGWLAPDKKTQVVLPDIQPDDLASIVYTSGTTGHPKGVMLSHRNFLANAYSGLLAVPVRSEDVFLSFLPLSHTLERTVGYYLPMMAGAAVAHARSVQELAKDLLEIQPTGIISVPRIFERVYARIKQGLEESPLSSRLFRLAVDVGWRRFEYLQGRRRWHPSLLLWPLLKRLVADRINQRLGGNLKVAISGGAALSPGIARIFVGLGVPILQGYGLTEASPVVSVNRRHQNIPTSIGPALPGVEARINESDELLVRGDNVMLGYWKDPEASRAVIDGEGWLHTGDKARIQDGYIYITGRIKDIIVMATGEKVSPVDMELAITHDALFEQAMVIGEGRPYLTALVVLNDEQWRRLKQVHDNPEPETVERILLERIADCVHDFPGYAEVKRIAVADRPWTVENDLLTATLKMKRNRIQEKYAGEIEKLYEGHQVKLKVKN